MKYQFIKNRIILEAESFVENVALMEVIEKNVQKEVAKEEEEEETTGGYKKVKTRKRQYTRICDVCGMSVKGAMGEGIHKAKIHGIRSTKAKAVTKSRKRNLILGCDICGRQCRGLNGLGVHKSMKHGIESPNADKNRDYYKKRTADMTGTTSPADTTTPPLTGTTTENKGLLGTLLK